MLTLLSLLTTLSIAQIQRQTNLNGLVPSSNGASLLHNPITTKIINNLYNISILSQNAYDIQLTLEPKWGFKAQTPTTLSIEIEGNTPDPTQDADLLLVFTSDDTQFFSFFIHIDDTALRSKIYPLYTLGSKPSVISWLSNEEIHAQRWERISDGDKWENTEPRWNKQSEWPLKFEIYNDPLTNQCIFSFYHQSNIYKTGNTYNTTFFAPMKEIKVYIMGDTSREHYQISNINIQQIHDNMVPTIPPSPSPTIYPSLPPTNPMPTKFPIFYPSISPTSPTTPIPSALPSYSPSFNPSIAPTITPTTIKPTVFPTNPALFPSTIHTISPSTNPTTAPPVTYKPTQNPLTPTSVTSKPTQHPFISPFITSEPTQSPSISSTAVRTTTISPTTQRPTSKPTIAPTITTTTTESILPTPPTTPEPTSRPTKSTSSPSTIAPTSNPSISATSNPSISPTSNPSISPTKYTTIAPTNPYTSRFRIDSTKQTEYEIITGTETTNDIYSSTLITDDPVIIGINPTINLDAKDSIISGMSNFSLYIIIIFTCICIGAVTILLVVAKRNKQNENNIAPKDNNNLSKLSFEAVAMSGRNRTTIDRIKFHDSLPLPGKDHYKIVEAQSPALGPFPAGKSRPALTKPPHSNMSDEVIMDEVLRDIRNIRESAGMHTTGGMEESDEGSESSTSGIEYLEDDDDDDPEQDGDGNYAQTETTKDLNIENIVRDLNFTPDLEEKYIDDDIDDSYHDRMYGVNPFKKGSFSEASQSASFNNNEHSIKKFQAGYNYFNGGNNNHNGNMKGGHNRNHNGNPFITNKSSEITNNTISNSNYLRPNYHPNTERHTSNECSSSDDDSYHNRMETYNFVENLQVLHEHDIAINTTNATGSIDGVMKYMHDIRENDQDKLSLQSQISIKVQHADSFKYHGEYPE